ncbi:MAG: hypothetical protein WD512_08895, partial [Candidatus Paceibacterota bacterium]
GVDIWIDKSVGRLNKDERGIYLGNFNTGDQLLVIFKDGNYEITNVELSNRYDMPSIELIEKYDEKKVISCVYCDGESKDYFVKRFHIETKSEDQKFHFISEHKKSTLAYVSTSKQAGIIYSIIKGKSKEKVEEKLILSDFIDVKGWKAQGNKLTIHSVQGKIKELEIPEEKLEEVETSATFNEDDDDEITTREENENTEDDEQDNLEESTDLEEDKPKEVDEKMLPETNPLKRKPAPKEVKAPPKVAPKKDTKYKPGDTLEFDF